MSVQSEIDRINGNVASTYTALSEMGATMPAQQNSDNLPGTVRTVPQGSSTSVQTDWNQTDETAPDYLKNKPFGDTKMEIIPLRDTQFVFSEDDGGYVAYLETTSNISNGDVVDVTWDGVKYSGKALDAAVAVIFGNFAAFGLEDTGEPFAGMWEPGMMALIDLAATEEVVRNISISKTEKSKISVDYLPGMITTYYINSIDSGYAYSDSGCTEIVTFEEAGSAVMYGTISLHFTGTAIRITPILCYFTEDSYVFDCGEHGTYTSALRTSGV